VTTSATARRARRGEILEAALRCFTRSGYARASIEDVVRESGASVGSIYHHFGGKEQLAAALYVEGLAGYQRGFVTTLEHDHANAEEAVKAVVAHHLRWVEANPELARFLLSSREAEVVEASRAALGELNRDVFAATRLWLGRWRGALREMPFGLLHPVLIGPSQEFARHWLAGRVRESIDEAEPVLAEAAWKAVRA
jgi:AcrR family transcriptional regulator